MRLRGSCSLRREDSVFYGLMLVWQFVESGRRLGLIVSVNESRVSVWRQKND